MKQSEFPKEEYYELLHSMEKFHEIFSCMWCVATPRFTDEVPTAAVRFDPQGACIDFMINEDYWNSLDDYSREFTVCHEMLHVILAHGSRMMPFRDKYDMETLNIALDLAVNHLLTSQFGFNRFFINNWKDLCWSDTVYKDLDLDPNKSFEYYINKVDANKNNNKNEKLIIVDHSGLSSFTDKANRVLKDAAAAINGGNDPDQAKARDEAAKQQLENCQNGGGAGLDEGTMFSVFSGDKVEVRKIKKWESVLDKYIFKSEKERETIQWLRLNRRLAFMDNSKLLLPSEAEVIDKDFYKYNIWLFLDYSGSCSHLKDIFFTASNTFDPRKFTVKKFAHTTKVAEFEGNDVKIWGGGTDFRCIENYIQEQINAKSIARYPDAIFHFTDGEGWNFTTEKPERWYVFLTNNGMKTYYPNGTNFFKLIDFVEGYNENRYGYGY